jgi:hypothetical protein
LPNFSYHPGTEKDREEREDIPSQGEILVRKLADMKEQCCTRNAKYGILVKRKKIV